jgi:polyisoprenyl-phosphate glycosyltransferase
VFGLRKLKACVQLNDVIVTMDSDGEDRPQDVIKLLEALPAIKFPVCKVVIARRTARQETLTFRLMYFFYKYMFRMLTGCRICSGNFALFSKEFLDHYIQHPYFDFCYSASLVALINHPTYVGCPRDKRYHGKSKMNVGRLIKHGLDMLMPFLDRVATRLLIVFVVLFGGSSVAAAVVVGIRAFTGLAIPGWATYTVLALMTMSFLAVGNFLLLFSIFSHSQGQILNRADQPYESS